MEGAAQTQSCVLLKTAVQKVLRIGTNSSRYPDFITLLYKLLRWVYDFI